ncbi:MAG: class I SAM-dependent methyltransferase [Candidatus Eisenbacteria bacterium]
MAATRSSPGLVTRLLPIVYDLGAPVVFWPVGGLDDLRERALDALDVRSGSRVLELGCGTGALTAKLIRRGAEVTAVDRSECGLGRARHRAPAATFVQSDILDYRPSGKFDRVLLAFVLHEMEPVARRDALTLARETLVREGRVGVLDWSNPVSPILRLMLRALVAAVEPRCARSWLTSSLESHLEGTGLMPLVGRDVAMGTARIVVAGLCEPA